MLKSANCSKFSLSFCILIYNNGRVYTAPYLSGSDIFNFLLICFSKMFSSLMPSEILSNVEDCLSRSSLKLSKHFYQPGFIFTFL